MIEPGRLLASLLNRQVPEVLYHYTSLSGIDGIARSKSVWASAVQYMNDYKEFRLAIEIARRQLDSERSRETNVKRAAVLQYLRDQLQRAEDLEVCVFSLSSNGDLLSQWRGYCPPNGGYSIGFGAQDLRKVAATQGAFLAPCVYDINLHEKLVADALKPLLEQISSELPSAEEDLSSFGERFVNLLLDQVIFIAPLIKHSSFREENEWRITWMPRRRSVLELRYRRGPRTYIPYVAVQLQHEGRQVPIANIIIGPMPHQYSAMKALSAALKERGLRCHSTQFSQVPYRTL